MKSPSTKARRTRRLQEGALVACLFSLSLVACGNEEGGLASGSGGTSTAGANPATGGAAATGSGGSEGAVGAQGVGGAQDGSGGEGAASNTGTGGGSDNNSGGSDGIGGDGSDGIGGSGSAENGSGGGSGGTTANAGGSGGGGDPIDLAFILGADISSVQESNTTYQDTDGTSMSIFEVLKNHGFNYIRVKAFVDPDAPYGYSSTENSCSGFAEPFGDKEHVIAFGKQIKEAGMGFLLDFHYSDVWADPGNQIIPDPWRGAGTIEELAAFVADYTSDVVGSAIDAGARPDMVQIGNEITPGMLIHVPGASTDCWGNNPSAAPFGGQASNGGWDNLAILLKAGIDAVRALDPTIKIMLHTENTDDLSGVKWWVDSALSRGIDFDVLGLSCYSTFQGQPSVWENTFTSLANDSAYDGIDFVIAEYNPNRTEANLMMKNLPDGRGLGTFFWEPTRSGEWGDSLFSSEGGSLRANSDDFAEYDSLLPELGL